ncbi:MAG: aminotransferase class I/II-fold pyridoxal phosphate-dependent enzyme [Flavobacteriia bacterium]|nr:aminotransferase class I/II-fold pyridoxal phosphate-dependent enzyme [Flavobacteriia bacterium]
MKTAKRLASVQEYYFSRKLREVRGLLAAGKPVINMGIGSPDLAPDPAVTQAMIAATAAEKAHQYQSYQGVPELRGAMTQFYQQQFGVSVNPEDEVLPLMGSKEGIMHISMAFLNPGDGVLIPDPGYPTYQSVSDLVEAKVIPYTLRQDNGWLPNIQELEAQDLSGVKLMWLSYPHMPTGAVASVAALTELVAFAKKHDILLVNDNPYSFVLNEKPVSILSVAGAAGHVLELNSLSKTFNMAGWRVGMLLGAAPLINAVLKVKSNMDSGMFYPLQMGAVAALAAGPDWFQNQNAVYEKRRALVYELASLLGCTYDTKAVGLFVWAALPAGAADAESFIDKLLYEKDIFITPGTIFGAGGTGYVRFSLCVSEALIKEAIERIKA